MASAGPFQSRPHAQKMTPNATATIEAMTMSMVRQRLFMMPPSGYREETHVMAGAAVPRRRRGWRKDRASCAGITQIRYEGLRSPALSALCAPLSDCMCFDDANTLGGYGTGGQGHME